MSQFATQGPIVNKPQPNIYTLLLIVAILALAVTIGFVMSNLMSDSGYGLTFGQLLEPIGELN